MNPTPLRLPKDQNKWTRIDFVPLQMGEIHPSHGCAYASDDKYWSGRADTCSNECTNKWNKEKRTRDPNVPSESSEAKEYLDACFSTCSAPFKVALEQEIKTNRRRESLRELVGKRVHVLGNASRLHQAVVSARLESTFDEARSNAVGASGTVLSVDVEAYTAHIELETSKLTFPLEVLALGKYGQHVDQFTSEERQTLAERPRYGECWSKCGDSGGIWNKVKDSLKNVATLGKDVWCYSASDPVEDLRFGSLCKSDDECGGVEDSDSHWSCVSACS